MRTSFLVPLWILAADSLAVVLVIGCCAMWIGNPGLLEVLMGPWAGHTWWGCVLIVLFALSRFAKVRSYCVIGAWLLAIVMGIDGFRSTLALFADSASSYIPPISFVLAAVALAPARPLSLRLPWRLSVMAALLCCGVFTHLLTIAYTDYRRPAQAAVVLGAGVFPGDVPSQAMRDRVLTAVELYHQGYVDMVVMSGGRNPARGKSEPEVMRELALALGVDDAAIVLDPTGYDSAATVHAAQRLVQQNQWDTILLVSHGYHFARLQMLSKAVGLHATTVPCMEERLLVKKPLYVAREVVALGAAALGLD